MVEIPEHDHRFRQFAEISRIFTESLGGETILAGRLEDVAGFAAITGNAAFDA
jgi:hypothetical protein